MFHNETVKVGLQINLIDVYSLSLLNTIMAQQDVLVVAVAHIRSEIME